MSNQKVFILLLLGGMFVACKSSGKVANFDSVTSSHQRIAVLPLESKIKLTDKQKVNVSDDEISKLELEQGKEVQEAVERYLLDKKLRVTIQSSNMTNAKLKDNKIDIKNIQDQDYTKLARLLGVDAVVAGSIETEKPMTDATATAIDVAKRLETAYLGTRFGAAVNTSTNKGKCSLSLFDGKTGDRLWTYSEDIEKSKGSTTSDVINALMNKGARNFPYRK